MSTMSTEEALSDDFRAPPLGKDMAAPLIERRLQQHFKLLDLRSGRGTVHIITLQHFSGPLSSTLAPRTHRIPLSYQRPAAECAMTDMVLRGTPGQSCAPQDRPSSLRIQVCGFKNRGWPRRKDKRIKCKGGETTWKTHPVSEKSCLRARIWTRGSC